MTNVRIDMEEDESRVSKGMLQVRLHAGVEIGGGGGIEVALFCG